MLDYQKEFMNYCIKHSILRFGQFILKSGRQSPYFFNAGLFNTGQALNFLGEAYQKALQNSGVDFDIIFGPAYKGIPLACSTASAFARETGRSMPWCFNRKEVKDHGEGGALVGASLSGKKIALIDDVITAGTAIGEVMPLLHDAKGILSLICIALDRQERSNTSGLSAVKEVEKRWGIPVISIISLSDILVYLKQTPDMSEQLESIEQYRDEYGY